MNSHVYKKCQVRLLEEIKSKQKRINILERNAQRVKEELQGTLSVLDFSYICSLFLVHSVHPLFCWGGGGLNLYQIFKQGGLDKTSTVREWLLEKEGVTFFGRRERGVQLYKNKNN